MNKEKALRLALEALEKLDKVMKRSPDTDKAIAAIKLSLEQERALQALHDENERLGLYKDAYGQPEPEPVAWTDIDFTNIYISELVAKEKNANVPLYTSQLKHDLEAVAKWMIDRGYATGHGDTIADLLKELEWQIKEKNT